MATFGGQVVIDPVALNKVLRGPDGPVMRRLGEDAERVRQEARRLCGYSQPDPLGREKADPVHLRDTIVKRFIAGQGWQVGSDHPRALMHHEGTQPHPIDPRRPGGFLVFWSGREGRVIYARHVDHPGTRPNRFLVNALAVLRGRY